MPDIHALHYSSQADLRIFEVSNVLTEIGLVGGGSITVVDRIVVAVVVVVILVAAIHIKNVYLINSFARFPLEECSKANGEVDSAEHMIWPT